MIVSIVKFFYLTLLGFAYRRNSFTLYCIFISIALIGAVPIAILMHMLLGGVVPPHVVGVAGWTTVFVATPLICYCIVMIRHLQNSRNNLRKTRNELDAKVIDLASAENRLRIANETLELRVEERTRELQAAKIAADQANETKSQFLANMSHELRTPLNAIIGFSEFIRNRDSLYPGGAAEKTDDYADAINRSGRHLLSLVTDLLDMSRIECGQFDVVPERLPLAQTVQDAVAMVDHLAAGRSQRIVTDLSQASRFLFADRCAALQTLINLLSNALKYSPEASTVRLIACDEASGTSIRVIDQGVGMSEEEQALATEPFSRFANAHVARQDSTGLGLSIVKEIMTLHGGTLSIESKKGCGTIVTIHFPLRTAVPPKTETDSQFRLVG